MSALFLSTLFGCWEGNVPNGSLDSGSTGSSCRLSYLTPGDESTVRVGEFTVDGLATIATPIELCTQIDGSQIDIGLDIDGTEAWISLKGDVGTSTVLPGTGVVVQVQYDTQTWDVADFYLGELRVDATSGALFGEATSDAGQIAIDVAWGD
ncbi:MAG: hypothetical protein GY913_27390 [Proteobacteria bacterium]|nr:hypothetical protein [Pseudomonadota bacterium]MCP4920640.1 hypothetical protein [Pseudomonadota bacterium]